MMNAREFSRIEMPVQVELKGDGASITAETRDISMVGMLVHGEETLAAGSLCQICITLGDTASESLVIQAHGKVARSDGNLMAIQFVDVDVDGYIHLKKLVMFNSHNTSKVEGEFAEHVGIKHV